MDDHHNRIYRFKGTPREIGSAAGRALGVQLEQTLNHYIAGLEDSTDMEKLHTGALPWLRRLPQRFQEEFEGMAEGATLPLHRLVEWDYIEECEKKQCSGAVCMLENHAWVARNNDTYVPEMGKRTSWLFSIACVRSIFGANQPTAGLLARIITALAKTGP